MTDSSPEAAPAKVEASILGELRQARNNIGAKAKPIYRDVPGYDGKLVVRYKWIPFKQLSSTSQSLSKITEPSAQATAAAADTVVATCDEICVRVKGADHSPDYPKGLAPLSTDNIPIDFGDPRLAYALGFEEPDSAREMAVLAFANEYALIEEAAVVVDWLKDTSRRVDTDFVGE